MRLYAHSDQPGCTSERIHDDRQWLNEEDGEQNVLGNRRGRYRYGRPPRIAGNQRRYWSRNNHADTENGA